MQNKIDYYKNFDTSNAKPIQPNLCKIYANVKLNNSNLMILIIFDADVVEILKLHNHEHDRQRVNTVLRMLLATA